MYTKQDSKDGISPQKKKVHFLQFCKRNLEVNNKASNIAYRTDIGRYPLLAFINQKNYEIYKYTKAMTLSSSNLFWCRKLFILLIIPGFIQLYEHVSKNTIYLIWILKL